ncbi:hypothetical protein EV380_2291 [Zhihengliuella halotolerans]|uniref:Uncharacterized protein n=1 Tax=Zhihengliuella halotolerans TaxID=370736 RepID=A0A4Q8AGB4_9MICC|nr:hypothetical protein EV380_2291 [Zhihengliuella halotolerans]
MSVENSTATAEKARKKRRARVVSAGDALIGVGGTVCVLSIAIGVITGLAGDSPSAFAGVVPGLLLVAIGYLKRIATALVEQL